MHTGGGIAVRLPRWLLATSEDHDLDGEVITHSQERTDEQLAEPPRYRVILHNDDYTPMHFVVYVLQEVFQFSLPRAEVMMQLVHIKGSGVVGIYPFEIAEAKVAKATRLAHEHGFPLLFTLEEEEPEQKNQ
jgi:ATP-dependent Clp protease adaptor protein ClpS